MTRSPLNGDGRRAAVSWRTAPVATGGRRRRWPWPLLAVLLATGLVWIVARSGDAPTTPPTSAARAPGQAEGFEVTLAIAAVTATDNELVFGGRAPTVDAAAVAPAVRQISQMVADYLDAVFVTPASGRRRRR